MTNYVFNDGGRAEAGYSGSAGDCVTRAIAIASGLPYQEVYDRLSQGCKSQRRSKHQKTKMSSARDGVHTDRKWFKDYMAELGAKWTPTMQIGSGCKVHLKAEELPLGKIVCSVSKHFVAVLDGVIHDTHDPSRDGTRCVYGYWTFP